MKFHAMILLAFVTTALSAQTAQTYSDAVLTASSDMANDCATGSVAPPPARPAPPAGVPRAAAAAIAPPPAASTCTDLGSTYRLSVGGKLYGLQRTAGDVRRENLQQSMGSNVNSTSGVLAFQPTGTHTMAWVDGSVMHVRLLGREGLYTIVFMR